MHRRAYNQQTVALSETLGQCWENDGAQERTRTSTSIQTLAPEASASTNSATWAGVVGSAFNPVPQGCQRAFLLAMRGFVAIPHLAEGTLGR